MIAFFKHLVLHNFGLKVLSLLLASGLWFLISRDEQPAEVALRAPIVFQHVPSQLEISSESIQEAQIRVRGPERVIRQLQANEVHAEIDLAGVKPGERTFDLTSQQVRHPADIIVVQVVPSQFIAYKIVQMQTLRRGILNVPHVEIKSAAIEKKSSVSGRLLVVAVMQIDGASVCFSEQIVFDLGRPKLRIHMRFFFANKTAVFGLDSNDPIHCTQLTHRIAISLSQKVVPHLSSSPQNRERQTYCAG